MSYRTASGSERDKATTNQIESEHRVFVPLATARGSVTRPVFL